MEDWKRRVMVADEKFAAALSQVADLRGELGRVSEKHNEFEAKLTAV